MPPRRPERPQKTSLPPVPDAPAPASEESAIAEAAPQGRPQAAWLGAAATGLVLVVCGLYSFLLSTHFQLHFSELRALDHYNYLATAISHGSLQAYNDRGQPFQCLDCIIYHGRFYIAYGPAPVLPQLLLNTLFHAAVPSAAIVWTITWLTLAGFALVARLYGQGVVGLSAAASWWFSAAVTLFVGFSEIYLHTGLVAYAWSQASACGQACVVAAIGLLLWWKRHPESDRWLHLATGALALAPLCKQNYLLALPVWGAILYSLVRRDRSSASPPLARLRISLVLIGLSIALSLSYNAARFGNPLETGIRYVNETSPDPPHTQEPRLRRFGMHVYNHFLAGIRYDPTDFPIFRGESKIFGAIQRDGSGGLLHNHPMYGLFHSMPWLLAALPGLGYFLWRWRRTGALSAEGAWFLALSALIGASFFYYMTADASWVRYRYDILFALSLCAAHAIVRALPAMLAGRAGNIAALVALSGAFCWQSVLGFDSSLGTLFSRTTPFIHWGAIETEADREWKDRVHTVRATLLDPPSALPLSGPQPPAPGLSVPGGSLYEVSGNQRFRDRLYRFTGARWLAIPHGDSALVTVAVDVREGAATRWEPLIESGTAPGNAQAVGIRRREDGLFDLRFDFWGKPGCESSPIALQPGTRHTLVFYPDPELRTATVWLDGQVRIDCAIGSLPLRSEALRFGQNTIGFNTMARSFSGKVVPMRVPGPSSEMGTAAAPPATSVQQALVTLNSRRATATEPLMEFGTGPGAADALGIVYSAPGAIRLRYDHWGVAGCESGVIAAEPGRPYLLTATLYGDTGVAEIAWDGKPVLDCRIGVFPSSMTRVRLGVNQIGFLTLGPRFSGTIRPAPPAAK